VVRPLRVLRRSTRYVHRFAFAPATNRIQMRPLTRWELLRQLTVQRALTRVVSRQVRLTLRGVRLSRNAFLSATDAYRLDSRWVMRSLAARRLRPCTGLAPLAPLDDPGAHGSVAGTSAPEMNVRAVGDAAEHCVGAVVQQWPVAVGAHVIGNACA
jgi:hypothetical protein